MLCESCGKKEAVVSYTTIIGKEQREIHLCGSCMEKKLREDLKIASFFDDGVRDIMENLLQFFRPREEEARICPTCGASWEDFKNTGKLGCDKCYEAFYRELVPLLENMQGAYEHVGEVSSSAGEILHRERELENLRRALKTCVEKEEYEKAAELRDKINGLLNLSEEG